MLWGGIRAGSAERWAGPCSGCCSVAWSGHATQPGAGDQRRGALSAPAGGGLASSGQVCNPRLRRPGQYSLTAWRDCTALLIAGDRGRWSTQRGDGDAVGRDLAVARAGAVLRSWRPSAVKALASGLTPHFTVRPRGPGLGTPSMLRGLNLILSL